MLGQQFFAVDQYAEFINQTFIPFYCDYGNPSGRPLWNRYGLGGGPSTAIISPDGSVYDILAGYGNPDRYLGRIRDALEGKYILSFLRMQYEQNPDDLMATYALAQKYFSIWVEDKGAELCNRIVKRADEARTISVPYQGVSVNLYEVARYGAAEGFYSAFRTPNGFEEFRAEFPESKLSDRVYRRLASIYRQRRGSDDGWKFFEAALNKYPDDPRILIEYVRYCINGEEQVEEGIQAAKKIVAMEPENVYYRRTAAAILLKDERIDEAEEMYGDAFIEAYHDDAGILNSYSWFWGQRALNLNSALKAGLRALELDDNGDIWDTVAMAYWKMGNYRKALEAQEKAVAMKPGIEDYKKRLEEIKKEMKQN